MKLLCSTGVFSRDPDRTDHRFILEYGPDLDVDGFEVIFYSDWYERIGHIAEDLRGCGLSFPAMHAEKSIGPLLGGVTKEERKQGFQNLVGNCRLSSEIGAQVLVLHLWGLPASDLYIERNLAALPDCLSIAEDHGQQLAVETVPCMHADPLSIIRRAIDLDERCRVALDTEFLASHDQIREALDADWLWQSGAVCHVHIKDYNGTMLTPDNRRQYLHPGEGDIDFADFFTHLSERDFKGNISLEASVVGGDGHVDIAKMRKSLDKLREYVKRET